MTQRSPEDERLWRPPTLGETLLLGASEALIAVDVLQTLDITRHPPQDFRENNPLLGPHPGRARILLSGLAAGAVVAGVWYALPPRVRWVVPLFVSIGEAAAIAGNMQAGLTLRF